MKKGFTLIELLVVIAIIGILSAVVLASLTQAKSKASDTVVKQNLSHIRSQAEILNSNNQGYAAACSDATVLAAIQAALRTTGNNSAPSAFCAANNNSWVAWAPLKASSGFWCVDITGVSKSIASAVSAGTYVCP